MNSFKDYMYYLLISPWKKVIKKDNQFYIICKVFGKLFDQSKQDIFRVREESMIISSSEKMLEQHGLDRGMKRLKGEDVESYRRRLIMKTEVAEKAGTNEGILIAVNALGYELSYVEPFYIHDPARWSEFILYLASKNGSTINDLSVIANEVTKVKPAGSKPSYGFEVSSNLKYKSSIVIGNLADAPRCNTLKCGTWPT